MRSLLGGRLKVDAWRGRCGGRFLTWWTADYRRSGAFALLNAGSWRRPYLLPSFQGYWALWIGRVYIRGKRTP